VYQAENRQQTRTKKAPALEVRGKNKRLRGRTLTDSSAQNLDPSVDGGERRKIQMQSSNSETAEVMFR